MIKSLWLVTILLFSLHAYHATAETVSVNIRINDQYGATIKNIQIDRYDGTTYTPIPYRQEKLGIIKFEARSTDSIVISAFKDRSIRTSVAELLDSETQIINRPFSFTDLVNPQFYIHYGGLWLLLFIVFAETGLFLGFFLPGDSLLFIAGVYSQSLAVSFYDTNTEGGNLLIVIILIMIAGILGNFLGYYMGFKSKIFFYNMKDSWFFKRKNLDQAHDFYRKYGGGAIFLARFLPLIRTFAPIIAGIVRMDIRKFTFYNILGCASWTLLLVGGGHYLDAYVRKSFHFELRDHLGMIVIILIVITTLPILIKTLSKKRKKQKP